MSLRPKFVLASKVSGALVGAFLLAILVLWAVPEWLVSGHHLTKAQRLKAANDARTPLVALVVALGATGTLYYTSRTYRLNADGHVTDRYSKAVDQLGDAAHTSVRVGGVYALERIGVDSPRDRVTILHVLGSFIRQRTKDFPSAPGEPDDDVKAALLAAANLLELTPGAVLNLSGANLKPSDLLRIPAGQLEWHGARSNEDGSDGESLADGLST